MARALNRTIAGSVRGIALSAVALLVGASLFVAKPAHALTILQGDSNGSTFSNLSCTSCAQSSISASQKVFTLGSTASGGHISTLSIVDTPFSATGDVSGLMLAQLQLVVGNKPGKDQTGVTFHYNLVLAFAIPSGTESQTFSLGVSGDVGSGVHADVLVSGLDLTITDPFGLGNVTLSNFRFETEAADSHSMFMDVACGHWAWDGGANAQTHFLNLLADVTYHPVIDPVVDPVIDPVITAVPEPSTLALFGAGLAGLGWMSRRRKP